MRVNLVVVFEPGRELLHYRFGVRDGRDPNVVAFQRADERLGHSVRLRADERRGARDEADLAGEAAGLASEVAAAVVGPPLDRAGQAVHPTEAMLDGGDHEVADILARDAAGRGDEAHGFTVAAVQREGDTDPLTVVAADLQAVRAPARVANIDGDFALVTTFLATANMALEQEAVQLHHAVDPLHVWCRTPFPLSVAAKKGMNPPVAVGGQVGHECPDRGDKLPIRRGWSPPTLCGGPVPGREVRAREAERRGDRAHREPSGHEITRKSPFLGAVTRSTASRRISFSSVFLPSSRCSSRICC